MTITMILGFFSSRARVSSLEIADSKKKIEELSVVLIKSKEERTAATSGLHESVEAQGASICQLQEVAQAYIKKKKSEKHSSHK